MSVAESIRNHIKKIQRGEPFTTNRFLKFGSRAAVDKAISRLVKDGMMDRVVRGVFVRPKKSRFVDKVMPGVSRIIEVIAKDRGEVVQIHGAEAARRFKLSTQMPVKPIYYTSGPSREIQVGKLTAKLMHTSNCRKLQHAGKNPGLALAALWYLGKEQVSAETIHHIQEGLSAEEFETLRSTSMPGWMSHAIETYSKEAVYA